MTNMGDDAYAVWQEADSLACAMDLKLEDAWTRYQQRLSGPPAEDLVKEVCRLRSIANQTLKFALSGASHCPA
jgi:hypothetical protein